MSSIKGKTYYAATYAYDARMVCNAMNPCALYGFPTKAMRDSFVADRNYEERAVFGTEKTEAITAAEKRRINKYIGGRYYMDVREDGNGKTEWYVKRSFPDWMY